MQNFPVEYIDKESGEKKTAWISRSVAVSGFIFCKDQKGNWYILANQRGEGVPDYKYCWNCVCGYLDYDENAQEAMKREVYEETGLDLKSTQFIPYFVNTNKYENRQNVTIRFYNILKGNLLQYLDFSFNNMEKNEVMNIKWIPIDKIEDYQWAFNHNEIIKETFNMFVNIPWYKKFIINKYTNWIIKPLIQKLYLTPSGAMY